MSAQRAIRATAQGSGSRPTAVVAVGAREPAGVPHRWQNFAPGVSAERQPEQVAPESEAPQVAQKCPAAGDPQAGQVVVGVTAVGIPENYTVAALAASVHAPGDSSPFDRLLSPSPHEDPYRE